MDPVRDGKDVIPQEIRALESVVGRVGLPAPGVSRQWLTASG